MGGLGLSAAPALAASPEPPELRVEPVFTSAASFDAVLNPHASAAVEAGTYQFVYRETATNECKGAGEKKAPASPAAYEGLGPEEKALTVAGLKAATEYAVCVVAENKEGKATSSPVSFATTVAAPAETPSVSVEDVASETLKFPSTEALFRGVIAPNAGAFVEPGTYQFVYRVSPASKPECKGSGQKLAPISEGLSLGMPHEEPTEQVKGLTAGTEYAVCLTVTEDDGEKLVSSPAVDFQTPVKPEKPETSAAASITATSVRLSGTLNPKAKAAVLTGWYFAYSHAGACTSEAVTGEEQLEAKDTAVGPTELTGLEPHQKYKACLVALNAAREAVAGNEVSFETSGLAPTVTGENAANVTPESATLEAQVNPENQSTTYSFQYATNEALSEDLQTVAGGAPLTGFGEQLASVSTGTLEQQTTYYYRALAKNASGSETGALERFHTPPEAPTGVEALDVTGSTATLSGVVNPSTPGRAGAAYEFLYQISESECESGERVAGISAGHSPEPVQAAIAGLVPHTKYTVCLAVKDAAGATATSGPAVTFETAATPVASDESSSHETETGATLEASIDPDGSEVSACRFEYGTTTGYGNEQPCTTAHGEPIGSGTEPVPVTAQLTGLEAATYHWRLVVVNSAGTSTGGDHTFSYQNPPHALPDKRAYEMVTPVFKDGGLIGDTFNGTVPDISEAGTRLIALSSVCFENAESCTELRSLKVGEPFEFTREATGWVATALAPPSSTDGPNEPWLYSATDGTALFTDPTGPLEEDEWYAGEQAGTQGSFQRIGPAEPPGSTTTGPFAEFAMLATADLSNVVWTQAEDYWPFGATTGRTSLYEYATSDKVSRLLLVAVEGGEGSDTLIPPCGAHGREGSSLNSTQSGSATGGFTPWNALSNDGRMVFFEVPCRGVYARVDGETPEAHTIKLSSGTGEVPPGEADFEGASEDGSVAYFKEGERLYESLCTKDCQALGEERAVTDITAGSPKPELQSVLATSADGSHAYFMANGVLTESVNRRGAKAQPGNCRVVDVSEGAGTCNLYVYERDERYPAGHVAFISSVPGADLYFSLPENRHANVTPDGKFLVFESYGALTSDDTRTLAVGEEAAQIFRYDAETEELSRVSVGEEGFNDDGNADTGDASIVWAAEGSQHAGPARGDPTMSDNGEYIFFQSPIALTPHAVNDVVTGLEPEGRNGVTEPEYAENVYEYHDGHVYLISDGRDTSNAVTPCKGRAGSDNRQKFGSAVCLLGTDATGHNVFFMTADQLVPKDKDTQIDIYDARICEPEAGDPCLAEPASPPPPCGEASCQGPPPGAPGFGAPASQTFSGTGNETPSLVTTKAKTAAQLRAEKLAKALKLCRRKRGKRRAACEKTARKAYGAKKAGKSASNERRSK
jgi:hypothetical protein